MTEEEGRRIDHLSDVLFQLKGRVEAVLELTPHLVTKEMCEERHTKGTIPRVEHLERSERLWYRMIARLQGMAIPVALCLGVVSLVISLVKVL